MSARRVLAFGVLAVLLAAPCSGVCTGWTTSGHERMACCANKGQGEADTCCASGGIRQNAESFGLVSLVAFPPQTPIASLPAEVVVSTYSSADLRSHDPLTFDTERYVLLSVFLI